MGEREWEKEREREEGGRERGAGEGGGIESEGEKEREGRKRAFHMSLLVQCNQLALWGLYKCEFVTLSFETPPTASCFPPSFLCLSYLFLVTS